MFTFFTKKIILWFLGLPGNPLKDAIRKIFYGDVVSERIVEYALCFAYLGMEPAKKVKVMDVGCYYSNFPIQLATMGYRVTGVDMQDYEFSHPNFKFVKGDVNFLPFKSSSFDVVTCISTLEHIGIGSYGDKTSEIGDFGALKTFHKLLKRGGILMITVPYGVKSVNSFQRVYDSARIDKIFAGFRIVNKLYFVKKKDKWLAASKSSADKVRSKDKTRAIIFVKAVKN